MVELVFTSRTLAVSPTYTKVEAGVGLMFTKVENVGLMFTTGVGLVVTAVYLLAASWLPIPFYAS